MLIITQATGVDMTDAIKEYVEEKIGGLEKYFDNIQKAEVDVGMHSHHHQKGKVYYAELNLYVPGKMIRMVKEAEDLYKAIDKVKDHMKVELEKLKGKMRDKDKKVLRDQKCYQE
ncbi:MAG: ribosomal subunit interface protein [Candidatus Magasanikbacteria bacterium CG_4_10_14_0_2_um_filter_37_12]|uniref:Ribosomal subunit interface protein n=1 Tax=Candidatus Magasanikbacteria bacterium CG_4_10_14_0_2_um_filter_37_12 TaxID=1974637 RepID=A0A2M7V987_9BACT|nr:MAG: ribosomal subunit interface protein [Candidatus Magasanikbacteria bacterium CG_4_10_14_0_2_um_filter_37_12]